MKDKHPITVTAYVVDPDTVHIGGRFFKQERTCVIEQTDTITNCGEYDVYACSLCFGESIVPKMAVPEYCQHCGAKVAKAGE